MKVSLDVLLPDKAQFRIVVSKKGDTVSIQLAKN